jgi:hypothetical protein
MNPPLAGNAYNAPFNDASIANSGFEDNKSRGGGLYIDQSDIYILYINIYKSNF